MPLQQFLRQGNKSYKNNKKIPIITIKETEIKLKVMLLMYKILMF
jgi:hypothetical protein